MASVVSKTSVKVDDLLAPMVVHAQFQPNGHLLCTTADGSIFDAGAGAVPISATSWNATTTYKFGDVVTYIGRIWLFTDSTPASNLVPVLNTDKWTGLGSSSSSQWVENDAHFDGKNLAASWVAAQTSGTATAALTTTSGEYETGPQALKISLSSTATEELTQLDENIIHAGETITVMIRAKLLGAAGGVTLSAKLYQNDAANAPVRGATNLVTTSAAESDPTLTTSWATYTFTITAAAGPANASIRAIAAIRAISSGTAATVVIDRIRTVRASTPALAPWPVGSIFMSVSSTNPAQLLGGGIWSAWGAGRVPVGVDTGQTEFDTVEETGGEKTHQLTAAEMPVHTHVQNSHLHTINHDHGNSSLPITTISDATVANAAIRTTQVGTVGTRPTGSTTTNTSINVPSFSGNSGGTVATNQNTGGDGAHNNLQPYITCYMWKRTA